MNKYSFQEGGGAFSWSLLVVMAAVVCEFSALSGG